MYIAIYVSAIVLICAGAIAFFVVKDKKSKKRSEKLQQKAKEENPAILEHNLQNVKLDLDAAKSGSLEKTQNSNAVPAKQEELENFSLNLENEKTAPKNIFDLNPFSLDDGARQEETHSNEDKSSASEFKPKNANGQTDKHDEEEDEDLDKKFKEYEEFLRRNLDLDDEEFQDEDVFQSGEPADFDNFEQEEFFEDFPQQSGAATEQRMPETDEDLRALQNFDYASLRGKSDQEIAEMIKSLPPKAQEILMTDILARRKFDGEE